MLRTLLLLLFFAPLLMALGLGAQRGEREPDPTTPLEIFAVIREQKDRTPRRLIEALGKMKTEAALGILKRSVAEMRGRWPKQYVFSAMRHFMDDEVLREDAIKFARGLALRKVPEDARAAAAAMSKWGEPVRDVLFEVAEDGWDDIARSHAISAVRDVLIERHDNIALMIATEAYDVPASGSTAQGIAVFSSFRDEAQFSKLAKFVGSSKSPLPRVLLVLDSMARHGHGVDVAVDEGVSAVLEQALKHRDYVVQYRGLDAVARRGGIADARAVSRLLKSKDAAVRRAALLAALRSQQAVERAGGDAGPRRLDLFKLAESDDGIERQAAAIGLGEIGGEGALAALHTMVKDDDWVIRAEAIRAVLRLRDRSSIPVLIEGLAGAQGRLRGDFHRALVQLTGLELGKGAGSWKTFWRKEQGTFQVPSALEVSKGLKAREERRKKGDSEVEFYGLEILSDAFVLVVDTSGSMNAKVEGAKTRLDVAKDQMTKTLKRVLDGVFFNVIPFSTEARPFSDGLLAMDPEAREESTAYVNRLKSVGGTNIYDSLSVAFEDERVDTIYLLSDGSPSLGDVSDPLSLRAEVERWNSVRGIQIHAIAVGQDHPLLKGLAKDSGGRYVRVD